MSYYDWIRPFLFVLPPEYAHMLTIEGLKYNVVPSQVPYEHPVLKTKVFGIDFPNPIGMAAGFDKNASVIAPLSKQGFGFVEVGTVTPKPQTGNSRPRLFRLTTDQAVINRMGFNNKGAKAFIAHLKARPANVIVGANIGKNKTTEDPAEDYITLLDQVYGLSDYIVVNISSPNTPGLRALQQEGALENFLELVMETRNRQIEMTSRKIPLVLKIDPDSDVEQRQHIAKVIMDFQVDGLIISNTTLQRPTTLQHPQQSQSGGLSGKPLLEISNRVLQDMYRLTEGKIPIIGVGGIFTGDDAYQKIRLGASLVQLYSSLVYQGFESVRVIQERLATLLVQDGFSSVEQAVGVDV